MSYFHFANVLMTRIIIKLLQPSSITNMLLLAISVFIASVIILVSMKLRKKNNFPETINKELIKYFSEAYFASVNVKKAQLLKAA